MAGSHDTGHLESILDYMLGVRVEEREEGYHFNPKSSRPIERRYSDNRMINDFVRWHLETEETRKRQEVKERQGD